jgi:hypothetical protein
VPEPVLELHSKYAILVSQRIVDVHVAPTRPTFKNKFIQIRRKWDLAMSTLLCFTKKKEKYKMLIDLR